MGNLATGTINAVASGTITGGTLTNLVSGTVNALASGTITGGTLTNLVSGTINALAAGTVTAGTLTNLVSGTINALAAGTITGGTLTNLVSGTINNIGTNVGIGTLSNVGSVNTVTALTTVTTVSNLTQGTVRMSLGTLTTGTLQNLVSGTVNIDPTPATIAPLIQGTLGTAGGSFFGTLSAASGAGTKHYITGISVVGQAGTADIRVLAGTVIQGTGVLGAGNVVPGGGYAYPITPAFATGTNSELTYHFVGAGSAFIRVLYWKGA